MDRLDVVPEVVQVLEPETCALGVLTLDPLAASPSLLIGQLFAVNASFGFANLMVRISGSNLTQRLATKKLTFDSLLTICLPYSQRVPKSLRWHDIRIILIFLRQSQNIRRRFT